ncbi:MAG: polysaccharide deacetylase family protein [Oscillibacter sp.]|nr:polysaccharide deacetylase family protein [Oscillibacter sp.]
MTLNNSGLYTIICTLLMLMFLCFSSFPPRFYSSDPLRYNGRSLPFPWGADNTQKILDVLAKYNVKTTFFVVGNWADQYPDTVKAITAAGHEVMNHSNAHSHFNTLSAQQIVDDVTACNEKIAAASGVTPTLIRCPFGEYDDHVISALRSMGMEPIQWSLDSLDWKGLSANQICSRIVGKVHPGEIILFHNAGEHTPEALPAVLESLIADGYSVVPVSQLLLTGECTIDNTGRQFSAGGHQ